MKKRMFVCVFIFMVSPFHHFAFGQLVANGGFAVNQSFDVYQHLSPREDIQRLLPDVLDAFKNQEVQQVLHPSIVLLILDTPLSLPSFLDPAEIDEEFISLLTTHDGLREMFKDEQFYNVLTNPDKIDKLVELIKKEKVPTTLEISSGDDQFGDPSTELKEPFVVVVKDQYGESLISEYATDVTFEVTENNGGQFSNKTKAIKQGTNMKGEASVILTLGPKQGIYKVKASVEGISQTVTFTAVVTGGGGEPPPEPIPTDLKIVSGNNQTGEVGKPLARPFVVEVKNGNKLLGGVDVTFTTTKGKGSLWGERSQTIATNENGKAGIILTLGRYTGNNNNSVEASVTRYPSLTQTFTATAIAPQVPTNRATTSLPVVYWIENGGIFQFDGGRPEELIPPSNGWTATSLAVDMAGRKLYWTEERQMGREKGRIRSRDLNGGNPKELQSTIAVPKGIVVNTKNDRLYWTNSNGKIQSIQVNGEGFEPNLIEDLGSPEHIALSLDGDADTASGTLFWTVDNEDGSWSIYCKRLGNSGQPKEIRSDMGKLGGIAVDGDKLYWTEIVRDDQGKIGSASRSGAENKTLSYVPGSVPLGLAVDKAGRRLYWADNGGNIQSLNLDNPIEIFVEGLEAPAVAIAVGRPSEAVPASPAAPSTIVEHSVESTLLANYPNPFNPETWIPYQLSESSDVSVSIYSVNGHLVRRLELGHQVAGVYRSRSRAAYWDGRNAFGERVASGLYFYTLTAGDFTATRKMLIRK